MYRGLGHRFELRELPTFPEILYIGVSAALVCLDATDSFQVVIQVNLFICFDDNFERVEKRINNVVSLTLICY